MSKKLKMVLYAEPGVGKSTFAAKTPKPFFICTDGNYSWLDLPEKDHVQVYSFAETTKIIDDMVNHPDNYNQYETIVIDLIEDLFKFCEFEYCQKNKLEHVGDKGYGVGYDIVANQFFIEICKLIGLDKHILFLTHGYTKVEKDRRGVEIYKFYPSNRIRDKVWDMIEGRVRYFLRAYIKDEEDNNRVIKKRYLSLIPKGNEFGIARGLDESKVPEDINLDWDEFASIIGLNTPTMDQKETIQEVQETVSEEAPVKRKYTRHPKEEPVEEKVEEVVEEKVEDVTAEDLFGEPGKLKAEPTAKEMLEEYKEKYQNDEVKEEKQKVAETVLSDQSSPAFAQPNETVKKEESQAEKLAKLKAKLAAMKK